MRSILLPLNFPARAVLVVSIPVNGGKFQFAYIIIHVRRREIYCGVSSRLELMQHSGGALSNYRRWMGVSRWPQLFAINCRQNCLG